jgi:hypothetical protein
MKMELDEASLHQLAHYKLGLVELFKLYYSMTGGENGHLITEQLLFPKSYLHEEYMHLARKHSQNQIIIHAGHYMYPIKNDENACFLENIDSLNIPYSVLDLSPINTSFSRLMRTGTHFIQSLGYDITAEAIWFLVDVNNPEKMRCLALPKEAYPDCMGYIDDHEILEICHFEINDWHNIPEAVADMIRNQSVQQKYLFDMLLDSKLDISY